MKVKAGWIVLVALFLAGCGAIGNTPDVLPTVVLGSNSPLPTLPAGGQTSAPAAVSGTEVAASGIIFPAHQVQIASAQGGNVVEVFVTAGEQVQSGQVLVRMAGTERLSAAVEATRTELLAAQQDLQKLEENAEQARTAALLRVANANKALDDAKKIRSYRQYRNGSDAMIGTARADLILANDSLGHAQEAYNAVSGMSEDSVTKAGALSALAAAQKAHDRAVANLNYLMAMPNQIDVDLVEAQLQAAQSEFDAAQREYDKLKNGPDPSAFALAEQRVKNAEAQLSASQTALHDVELTAPFEATVAALNVDPGAWVTPGQPLLVLADLSHYQVKTTDLSERDVPFVRVGQPVQVQVEALGIKLSGKVREISPLAESLGGDVVYTTTINLVDPIPAGLRAGMSVNVSFLPEP